MPIHHIPEFEYQLQLNQASLSLPIFADSIENSLLYHHNDHVEYGITCGLKSGIGHIIKSDSIKPGNKTNKQCYTVEICSLDIHKSHLSRIFLTS